ncbi:uncharacterized protein LOC143693988 [Agelaius phoeniceus]|uniref:uncharacterized protein LOC143693988 n=1 Tax=Agelaius phoeniceus TaxID=39638 RepID=UPI0040552506
MAPLGRSERSGLRGSPLPRRQPRRGPSPALRGPQAGSPPRGSAQVPPLGIPAPRLSASTSAGDPRPAAQRRSPCSRSPPRGSFQGFQLRGSACPLARVSVPRARFGYPPRVLSLALPLRSSARSSLARLRGSARTLPVAHTASRPLLLGSLRAPAIPGGSRPGWRLRSPRARPGAQRSGAALPSALPARSPLPGPGRPPPPPCEHAPPPGTPRPGRWAPRPAEDGTARNGKERCSRASRPPRSFPPSKTESPSQLLGAVTGSLRSTRGERGPTVGSGEMTPSIPGARGAVQDGHGHSSAGLSLGANGAQRCRCIYSHGRVLRKEGDNWYHHFMEYRKIHADWVGFCCSCFKQK